MPKMSVDAMVEGGKATAAPPLGPALGPTGLNIGQVIQEINKKTADFKGMQVPVKIVANTDDKTFTISVGTPPVSALIKKEANLERGSGNPLADKVANIRIEQAIKVAKMKADSLMGKDYFAKVKEVMGTCNSMGVMIEGMSGRDAIAAVNDHKFDSQIKSLKTELTAAELKALEEERKRLQEEAEKRKAEFEATAKSIIEQMAGSARGAIKAKLIEAKIPTSIIEALLPAETAAAAAGGKPGAPGAPAAAPAKK